MPICRLGWWIGGPVDNFCDSGVEIPQREGTNLLVGGGIGQRNVGLTSRNNEALRCGCSVPAAERLSEWTRLQWALHS